MANPNASTSNSASEDQVETDQNPASGGVVVTAGTPPQPFKDINIKYGEFDHLGDLFWNVAANAVNICAHDNNTPTPQKPFWHVDFDGTVADKDEARVKIKQLLTEIGIQDDEQSFWLNKKDDGTFEAVVHTHDAKNLEDLGEKELGKAKTFCSTHHINEPTEIAPEERQHYLYRLLTASVAQRYGIEPDKIDDLLVKLQITHDQNHLESVNHSASKTIFDYQSDDANYAYGKEKHTVIFDNEKLSASHATDNTVKSLVLGAIANQSAARQSGNKEWDTFNIDAKGADLAITAIAFLAAGLELNDVTRAELEKVLQNQGVIQKVEFLAKKDPYLRDNMDKIFGPSQQQQAQQPSPSQPANGGNPQPTGI